MMERHGDDYVAFFRELVQTTLVVRVDEEGDYTLEYTDKSGAVQSKSMPGLKPGEPTRVSGADPLAPAVLKKGTDVVTSRIGIQGDWWHVGDVPLGFNVTEGSSAVYDFTSRLEETISLQDLNVEEQGFTVESANFQLRLPIEGEVKYDLGTSSGADGAPLTLEGSVEIPPSASDLATLEVSATMQGETGTAGFTAGIDQARANGAVRTWWVDGEPVAGQFLGAAWSFDPRVTMWAEGFFEQMAEGQNCAGASKADKCEPDMVPTDMQEGSEAEQEKEEFPVEDYPRLNDPEMSADDRAEAEQVLDALKRFFALDIVEHDRLSIVAQMSESDFAENAGPDAPRMSMRFEFLLEVAAAESVTVPAGTFDALKITEEMRTKMTIQEFENPQTGEPLLNSFAMDEIVARNTFWLEEETFRPLKMEASTPMDVDALLKRMMSSVSPSAWDQIGGKPIEDNDWRITVNAESRYEATQLRGSTNYAPLVGLTLAHAISSSSSAPLMWAMGSAGMGMGGMFGGPMMGDPYYGDDTYYTDPMYPSDPYPTPYPGWESPQERSPPSLSLTSAGALANDVKPYTVASATGSWSDISVTVDGNELYPAWSEDGSCITPAEGEFAACRAGQAIQGWEDIEAGDSLAVYAMSGSTLRIIDYASNSVILTLTVG